VETVDHGQGNRLIKSEHVSEAIQPAGRGLGGTVALTQICGWHELYLVLQRRATLAVHETPLNPLSQAHLASLQRGLTGRMRESCPLSSDSTRVERGEQGRVSLFATVYLVGTGNLVRVFGWLKTVLPL
jgi:hypothetical protein